MIKHIVCFKLLDNAPEKKKEAADVLLSMKGRVPTALKIEVGTDFLGSPRSYDVILMVDVADRAALDAYQADPYHVNTVKTYMHAHTASSIAVDYVF